MTYSIRKHRNFYLLTVGILILVGFLFVPKLINAQNCSGEGQTNPHDKCIDGNCVRMYWCGVTDCSGVPCGAPSPPPSPPPPSPPPTPPPSTCGDSSGDSCAGSATCCGDQGYFCNETINRCYRPSLAKTSGSCWHNVECATGYICSGLSAASAGTCIDPNASPPPGAGFPRGSVCGSNGDCASNSCNLSNGYCYDSNENFQGGATCYHNSECVSNDCTGDPTESGICAGADSDSTPSPGSGIGITIRNPLSYNSIEELVDAIINFIFNIAIVLAPLMIVIGGFYFVVAAGDPEKIKKARAIITWSLIGFGIVILSKGLILVLKDLLGVS